MTSIRQLYRPVQPSISLESRDKIQYLEMPPHENLQEFIFCYWQLKSNSVLEQPFSYRVVSDGCIDIIIEKEALKTPYITGFSTSYAAYDVGNSFNYLGIRFLPGGFPQLFDLPAYELTNQFAELSGLIPKLTEDLADVQYETSTFNDFKDRMDILFLRILKSRAATIQTDPRVINAMNHILQSNGTVSIQEIDTGLSERQLRRLFKVYYGDSPKTFSKVVRFQNVLRAKPSTGALQSQMFYSAGYFDQSHFIKEFKNFYGETPSSIL